MDLGAFHLASPAGLLGLALTAFVILGIFVKLTKILVKLAFGVLFLALAGGAAWWYLGQGGL